MEFSEYLPDEAGQASAACRKNRRFDDQTGTSQPVCGEVGDRIDDHAIQNEPHDTLISASLTWVTGGSGAQSTAASSSYRQRGRTMTRRGLSTGREESHGKQD
jgi:hypothetical protein